MPPKTDVIDVGTLPYPIVRSILLQVNSAKQLRQLEENSPQLEGDDAECWMRLINRDFPVLAKRHNFEPRNPTSWHKVYARYERLEADQKREAEEKLKAAFAGIKKEKAENVSTIINFDRRKLPHPPLDGRGPIGGSRARGATGRRGGGPDESDLRFTSGTRTKTTSGKSILRKARREAREIQHRNRLAIPTGLLPVQRGQITAAPQGMLDEARIKAQPAIRIQAPGSSGSRGSSSVADQRRARELEEREARLRRMKNTSGAKKDATVLSDSDLQGEDEEDEDDGDGRDLFDADDDDDDDDAGGAGGLDAEDLEGLFDDKQKPSPIRISKAPALASKGNPVKRSGLLSDAPGSFRNAVTTRSSAPRPNSHSTGPDTSPPAKASSSSVAGSPEAARPQGQGPPPPGMQRKRKPVDIFMKPKPKSLRR